MVVAAMEGDFGWLLKSSPETGHPTPRFEGGRRVFKTWECVHRDMADEAEGLQPSHRLDVLGFLCPVPVAKTREALDEGAVLEVLADDPETLQDMPMLIGRGPHRLVQVHEEAGEIRFLIEVVTTP